MLRQTEKRVVYTVLNCRKHSSSHGSCKTEPWRWSARALQNAPSSMIHGAAMAALHITSLAITRLVQQFICPQARRGVFCQTGRRGAQLLAIRYLTEIYMRPSATVGVALIARPERVTGIFNGGKHNFTSNKCCVCQQYP